MRLGYSFILYSFILFYFILFFFFCNIRDCVKISVFNLCFEAFGCSTVPSRIFYMQKYTIVFGVLCMRLNFVIKLSRRRETKLCGEHLSSE